MIITNPASLREKDTRYSFLRFWEPNPELEDVYEENDGGSCPHMEYPDNLRGLVTICRKWQMRGNSFYGVGVRELVDYVQRETQTLKDVDLDKLPKLLVDDWTTRIFAGDTKLRRAIGIKSKRET